MKDKIKLKLKTFLQGIVIIFVREFIRLRYGASEIKGKDYINSQTLKNRLNRNSFYSYLEPCQSILEIGCFDRPSLKFLDKNRKIDYADYFSKDELINRARKLGRNEKGIPDIKYVLSEGYDQIEEVYDAVVSNHCIEHVPDLIRHLKKVIKIIDGKGAYMFSVPDKRLTFDHFIRESTILDIIAAYLEKKEKPSLVSVMEHYLFTSHEWFLGKKKYETNNILKSEEIDSLFHRYLSSSYVDVHCWQFTPESMKKIINQLAELGFIKKPKSLKVFPYGGSNEFYVCINFSDKINL